MGSGCLSNASALTGAGFKAPHTGPACAI